MTYRRRLQCDARRRHALISARLSAANAASPDMARIAAVSLAVFIAGGWLVASSAGSCENRTDRLDQCLKKLPGMLQDSGSGLPTSPHQLDIYCSAFQTGMGCVDEYLQCASVSSRRLVEQQVEGARYTFRFLCDDAQFRAEYLQYTDCYRAISDDWTECADRFMTLVNEDTAALKDRHTRMLELCCAKHGFLVCVYVASRARCRRSEAMFLQRIGETLSSLQVYSPLCRQLGVAVCSRASAPGGSAGGARLAVAFAAAAAWAAASARRL
ncbi:uncharacterized protein LOC124594375 [Schistocerca americana]|uniref:uncharacterized protein LOC124594375 n=1 Tax=Schistocerca americana TaxID=7009 RepID=UPI001F4F1BDC|nr:uncharacterized protein LOC124594375 [Schistocerca americana]